MNKQALESKINDTRELVDSTIKSRVDFSCEKSRLKNIELFECHNAVADMTAKLCDISEHDTHEIAKMMTRAAAVNSVASWCNLDFTKEVAFGMQEAQNKIDGYDEHGKRFAFNYLCMKNG